MHVRLQLPFPGADPGSAPAPAPAPALAPAPAPASPVPLLSSRDAPCAAAWCCRAMGSLRRRCTATSRSLWRGARSRSSGRSSTTPRKDSTALNDNTHDGFVTKHRSSKPPAADSSPQHSSASPLAPPAHWPRRRPSCSLALTPRRSGFSDLGREPPVNLPSRFSP